MRADIAQHRPEWSPHFKAPKKVYLPLSPGDEERAMLCGAKRGYKGSLFCLYEAKTLNRLREFLPLGYRGEKGLVRVELIPRTAWFGSLAKLLTIGSWRKVKGGIIKESDGRCRVCGGITNWDPIRAVRRSIGIEAHEIWRYYRSLDGGPGVQRLVGIMPVCGSCHMMFHLGLAQVQGVVDYAAVRLQYFNYWEDREAEVFVKWAFELFHKRSEMEWVADVSLVDGEKPLVVRKDKLGWAKRLRGARLRIESDEGVYRFRVPARGKQVF